MRRVSLCGVLMAVVIGMTAACRTESRTESTVSDPGSVNSQTRAEEDADDYDVDPAPHACAVLTAELFAKSSKLQHYNYGELVERRTEFEIIQAQRGLPRAATRQEHLDAVSMIAGGMTGMAGSQLGNLNSDGGLPDSDILKTDVSEYKSLLDLEIAEHWLHEQLQSIKGQVEGCLSRVGANEREWAKLSIVQAFDDAGWGEIGESIGEGNPDVLKTFPPLPQDQGFADVLLATETDPQGAIEHYERRLLLASERPETDVSAGEYMAVLHRYIAEAYASLGDPEKAEEHLVEAAQLLSRAGQIDPRVSMTLRRMYLALQDWSEIETLRADADPKTPGTRAHRYQTIHSTRAETNRAIALLSSESETAVTLHKKAVGSLWKLLMSDPENRTLRSEWVDQMMAFLESLRQVDPAKALSLATFAQISASSMAYQDPTWQTHASMLQSSIERSKIAMQRAAATSALGRGR